MAGFQWFIYDNSIMLVFRCASCQGAWKYLHLAPYVCDSNLCMRDRKQLSMFSGVVWVTPAVLPVIIMIRVTLYV